MQNSGGSRRGHLPGLGSENQVVRQSGSQTVWPLDSQKVGPSDTQTVRHGQSEFPRDRESDCQIVKQRQPDRRSVGQSGREYLGWRTKLAHKQTHGQIT